MAPEKRRMPGARGVVVAGILGAGLWATFALDLAPGDLLPGRGGLAKAADFFAHAFTPALTYEDPSLLQTDAPPLLLHALEGARATIVIAAAAMSLALVVGLVLGFFASTAWWAGDPAGARTRVGKFFRNTVAPAIYGTTRAVIALMRSVHELLWAVLFLAAVGSSNLTGVLAIAIPYGGTLAKVFSELIDEAPRDTAEALRGAGASPLQVFFFGLLPRALPDMSAYAFYRFECALRSAAILGFLQYPTIGQFIRESFSAGLYGETWTYLYALFFLVVVIDLWSGALRRRFVA